MRILRRFFHPSRRDAESARDIQFYLDTETEDNIARGMPPEEARAAAHRKFGNPTIIREDIHRMNGIGFLETTWQDLRFSLRTMRKSPAFTLTAILTLALGIGGNTAIFTLVRGVLLKPLEYRDPDRLVQLSLPRSHDSVLSGSFSPLRLQEMRVSAQSFTAVGAFLKFTENVSLSGRGEPEAFKSARVSANFLDVLGVVPLVGRGFLPEEDTPGAPPVAMISARLWRRRFDTSPRVAGQTAILNSTPYTIVGVLPDGFAFPFAATDVWVTRPAEWSVLKPVFWPYVALLNVFARLKPGVPLSHAQAELDVLNRQYILAHPERLDAKLGITIRAASLQDYLVANLRPTLWLLFGAVSFVLLIACANVAGLLLARASTRNRELAIRAAVGAGRGRLVRQLLAESLLLSLAGGAFGVLLAQWLLKAIAHVDALSLPGVAEIQLDGAVLAFTVALSIATGILFGLFPSLEASRPHLAGELRASAATSGSAAARSIFGVSGRGLLVVGQISLSIVLLIGATLLLKSLARLRGVDPGFQSANVLTMKIALPLARYDTDLKKSAFFRELERRVENMPGVRGAGVAMSLPTIAEFLGTNVSAEGQPPDDGDSNSPSARLQSVTPGYFRALRIPLLRGREFTTRDNAPGAPPAVIINESFARRFWPAYPRGRDPVGQHMREGIDRTGWVEIVGIVADVHEGDFTGAVEPEFYVPTVIHAPQTAYLAVRTAGDPLRFVDIIRKQVLAMDSGQPVSDIKTMDQLLEAALGPRRLTMTLLGSFAGVALLLAIVGMYGVIAYSVARRTQEVGIRRALGAQQSDILRLVLSQGLALSLAGVAIGIAGAFALTRVMKGLLFHVTATDPAVFAGIGILFVIVALAASYIPARRAARIDPMVALRI